MKLWIDDVRPAPEGYVWLKSVNHAIANIKYFESVCILANSKGYEVPSLVEKYTIELIDIDHDAGDYATDGGDYVKLLDWLEETGRNYPIRIHSMNPVGIANMRTIIRKNDWKEVIK